MTDPRLESLIVQMLSEHRLVPLRGIGTLVAHTVAARPSEDCSTLLPPCVQISLIPGDGSGAEELIARLSSDSRTSIFDAQVLWEDAVSEWRFIIGHGGQVMLHGIGVLVKEPDGRIRLHSGEEMEASCHFGLRPVQAVALRDLGPKVIRLPDVDVRKAVRYAVAAAILAFAVWIPVSMNDSGALNLSLTPLFKSAEVTYSSREFNPGWDMAPVDAPDPFDTVLDSISALDLSGSGHAVRVRMEILVPIDSSLTEAVLHSHHSSGHVNEYDLVVAEFESQLGARGHAAELRVEGIEADYIGEHHGKHLVSIGHFNSDSAAQERLISAKKTHRKAYVCTR